MSGRLTALFSVLLLPLQAVCLSYHSTTYPIHTLPLILTHTHLLTSSPPLPQNAHGTVTTHKNRVNKVSDLARTVSQQATARASTIKGELSAAQDQARRSRRRAAAAEARAAALSEENAKLKQQMALLEQVRLSHDDFRTSACAREYLFSHSVSLY